MNQQTDEMPNLYVSTKVNPNGNSNKENYNNPKKKKKIFIQYLYRDFEIRKMKISFFLLEICKFESWFFTDNRRNRDRERGEKGLTYL